MYSSLTSGERAVYIHTRCLRRLRCGYPFAMLAETSTQKWETKRDACGDDSTIIFILIQVMSYITDPK